jgi:hypothetical protein
MQEHIPEKSTLNIISSKQFRGFADTAAGKTHTLSQRIWLQLRSPFLLPTNGCVNCVNWEAIEYAKMGCRTCGNFHICCASTCPLSEIENNHVCIITGVVVKTITYDSSEYLTTATREIPTTTASKSVKRKKNAPGIHTTDSVAKTTTVPASCNTVNRRTTNVMLGNALHPTPNKKHTVSHCINFHERVCLTVLCSDLTSQSYEKGLVKLRNRLRWSFMRHVRSFKMKRQTTPPNVILMISNIATDIENYRLPIMNDTRALRQQLAYNCAQDIFKFTCSMMQSNALFTLNLDPTTMIIGVLFLLRSGLVHKNITILPRYRVLSYLLPSENYTSMFGVKSKIITESENIVKCHLRTLSDSEIKDIGYESFDRVV